MAQLQGKPLPEGELKDPFQAAGDIAALQAEEPNVVVYLANDVLRKRELVNDFSRLLTNVQQWDQLIGGTELDPLKDFDHLLLTAPQMGQNADKLVAVVHYNIPAFKVKEAIDVQVKRAGKHGKWLDGHPMPVAVIGEAGYRRAVILPNRQLLVVLPDELEEQIPQLTKLPPFEKSGAEGIIVELVTPSHAFTRASIPFPESISRMRLHFTLQGERDYHVTVEAWDASPDQARENASKLEAQLDAAKIDLPGAVSSFFGKKEMRGIGKTTWETRGNKIYARANVSHQQPSRIIGFSRSRGDARQEHADELAKQAREAKAKEAGKGTTQPAKSSPAEEGADDAPPKDGGKGGKGDESSPQPNAPAK